MSIAYINCNGRSCDRLQPKKHKYVFRNFFRAINSIPSVTAGQK